MLVSFPQATTGLVPISYRRALLSTLLRVSLIPISHNRPSAYQLQRSATEDTSICKSHSHKLQEAYYLSDSEERYLALFYTRVCLPQATTGLVPITYRGVLLSTLLHVSLIQTSNRPPTHQLLRSATDHTSTCTSHSHQPQQV
jgi:hypothetical protein